MINNSRSKCTIVPHEQPKFNDITPSVTVSHQIDEQHQRLVSFLASTTVPLGKVTSSSSKKLSRLTIGQLNELLTDLCDEIDRRLRGEDREPFLAIKLEYSPKRNQARQKLADLSDSRFTELTGSVNLELERRFPELNSTESQHQRNNVNHRVEELSKSLASLPDFSTSAYQLSNIENMIEASTTSGGMSTTLATPSSEKALSELPISAEGRKHEPKLTQQEDITMAKDQPYAVSTSAINEPSLRQQRTIESSKSSDDVKSPSFDARATQGRSFNFDCLNSLLNELNVMISKEQTSEVELLKKRHNQEMSSLKEYIEHLENQMLPEKNQEIARLAARIEDVEIKLAVSRKEYNICAHRLTESETAFKSQASLLEHIQNAYIQLQHQLAQSIRTPKPTIHEGIGREQRLSNISSFNTIWAAYSKVQESALHMFDNFEASLAEKVSGIKDACAVAQRLIRDAETLLTHLEKEKLPWLIGDIEAATIAKTNCIQTLSYCVVCGKDIVSGQVKSDRKVRDALTQLTHAVRGLVDAIELVVSRAQVPPIQQQSPILSTMKVVPPYLLEPKERFQTLLNSKVDQLMATFHALRNFIQSQSFGDPNLLVPVPPKLCSSLNESLTRLTDIIQVGREINTESLEKQLIQLDDAIRKLQLTLLNGSGILADEASHIEAINSCNLISQGLQHLLESTSFL